MAGTTWCCRKKNHMEPEWKMIFPWDIDDRDRDWYSTMGSPTCWYFLGGFHINCSQILRKLIGCSNGFPHKFPKVRIPPCPSTWLQPGSDPQWCTRDPTSNGESGSGNLSSWMFKAHLADVRIVWMILDVTWCNMVYFCGINKYIYICEYIYIYLYIYVRTHMYCI